MTASLGSGENGMTWHRERMVLNCRSGVGPPIRIRSEPGGGSSSVFRKALAASADQVVGVVQDGHLAAAAGRFER